jgi:competence protein ComEC
MIYQFTVSFILGIVFEKYFHFGWSVGVLVFLVSSVLFFYFKNEDVRAAKIIFAIGLAFALGILRMSFVDVSPDQNLLKLVGQKISFEAVISNEPDVRDTSARYVINPTDSKSSILLIADRYPEFKYGDKIKVSGKLDLPKNFLSREASAKWDDVEFDYINYLAKDQIHFVIYQPTIDPTSSSSTGLRGTRKIVSTLYSLKNIFIQKISDVVPEPNSSLLGGVIFGAKQSLGQNLLDDFKKVGLIHIVVLSGYNITIIAVGVFYLTAFLKRRNIGFILSVLFIILFAVMVGLGATVIRAVIMAFIAILARFLGRPADALRWLFIAGLLMLVWNPLILFYDPSFQLSFMATLGLILFSETIDKKLLSPVIKFLIKMAVPISFIAFLEKIKIREIISSTLAVQFFVLPLLIKMSGFISLISFLVNPLILPLVPWVMGLGALTGALGIIPFLGQILSWPFGVLSYFLTQIIISIVEFSARIPLATLQTGSISLWLIFIWYVGYGILFIKLKKNFVQ